MTGPSHHSLQLIVRYLALACAVVLINFFLPRLLPGDPLNAVAGDGMGTATPLSGAARIELRAYYHLDQPLGRQLMLYLQDLSRGDLGWSIESPAPVGALILDRLPWTLALMGSALGISALVGTALGLLAGWFPGRARNHALTTVAGALASIPEFLIAIALLLVFALGFGWFPLLGGRTVFADFGAGGAGAARRLLDIAWHLALPASALALAGIAGFLLIGRDSASGLRNASWAAVARAKGLRERDVALRHALPNLALPLLTYFGLRLGAVLGGALVVERVFGVPGLGLLAYDAVRARDYPVLQAVFLLASLGVLAANFGVELVYSRIERRLGAGHA